MLYWKYSPNRVFFINEYYVLIPTMILINYVLIRQIKSYKRQQEELKKLREQIEAQKRIKRILWVTLGFDGLPYVFMRGGGDVIDVSYIDCGIEKGYRYLNNDRLRKIIHDLYRHKRKGKIIYITSTAVCHLAHRYGQDFLALPIAMGDFGLTSLYQTVRKILVVTLLGGVAPLWYVGGPVSLFVAFFLGTTGLKLAFSNLDYILTSAIPENIAPRDVQPRIADLPDVVVVNNKNSVNKLVMSTPKHPPGECWLPEQSLFNPNCKVTPMQIPNAIELGSNELTYSEVVNMQDVTGLDRVAFSDILDVKKASPTIQKSTFIPDRPKGKMVKFLEKFGDSSPVREHETWEIPEVLEVPEVKVFGTNINT